MLTLRPPQAGQNGRGGKYTLAQASQRCRRNSPAFVPSQKCWVSGVGFGLARAGSAISVVSSKNRCDLDATFDYRPSTVQQRFLHAAYSGIRTIVKAGMLV